MYIDQVLLVINTDVSHMIPGSSPGSTKKSYCIYLIKKHFEVKELLILNSEKS